MPEISREPLPEDQYRYEELSNDGDITTKLLG